jgi:hypothetical protein
MEPEAQAVFRVMGHAMSARNEYSAVQASDLYPTNGDSVDWLYGEEGIFAFTFELYPATANPGFYPPDSIIPSETARNRGAVTYLIAASDNPYKVIGRGGDVIAPSVEISSPAAASEISGTITISVTATDDVGVTLVEFRLDGTTLGLDDRPPFDLVWDSRDHSGAHILEAAAYDHGHNEGVSGQIPVVVHSTAPEPTATATPTLTVPPTQAPTATPTTTSGGRHALFLVLVQNDAR